MGGMMSVTGFADTPTKVGVAIGDYLGAYNAAIAILAALHYRSKTGEGQEIDISMQDGIWALVLPERGDYFETLEVPKRYGNKYSHVAPFGSYAAKEGFFVMCIVTDIQWANFLRVVGREDLVGDKRYATREDRTNLKDEVDALVEVWSKKRSAEEILKDLKAARIPCGSVPTFDQVANDPQLLSREMIVDVEQPVSGKLKLTGSVFKMSRTPGNRRFPAPSLGEHNDEVYSTLLGFGRDEIQKLKADGIV
jgi:crotonobetainyl-CoA:carnitine CoA-transferase CaiB-like acyl-CoA transferase